MNSSIHCTPAAVAVMTGVSVPKQNQWSERGTIRPSRRDKKPTGSGDYRMMSVETVYQFAITSACAKLGMPARLAAEGARHFCVAQPGRPANEPYPFGRTLLLITPTGEKIVNADFNATLTDICGRPFQSAIVVDVGQIIAAVDNALTSTKDN
jgi:hypothetical protein